MLKLLEKLYRTINNIVCWPMRQIKNLWIRAVVSWIGHTAVVVGLCFYLGYRFWGPLGAVIAGWLGMSFYIARETLKWPPKRPDIDRFMDAEMPFTGLWWAAYLLLG